jgi:hypothetical protein
MVITLWCFISQAAAGWCDAIENWGKLRESERKRERERKYRSEIADHIIPRASIEMAYESYILTVSWRCTHAHILEVFGI